MDWIKANPSNNFNNKYLLFCLVNIFKIKCPKDYLELIKKIVKNSKIYIFEKDTDFIKNSLFYKCKSLTNVDIPNSVKNIQIDAFNSCGLSSIVIPDSVVTMESYVFYNCMNLQNVIISGSVTYIGYGSFHECNNLITVTIVNNIWFRKNIASRNYFFPNNTELKNKN